MRHKACFSPSDGNSDWLEFCHPNVGNSSSLSHKFFSSFYTNCFLLFMHIKHKINNTGKIPYYRYRDTTNQPTNSSSIVEKNKGITYSLRSLSKSSAELTNILTVATILIQFIDNLIDSFTQRDVVFQKDVGYDTLYRRESE
jgi:hypothetical protein